MQPFSWKLAIRRTAKFLAVITAVIAILGVSLWLGLELGLSRSEALLIPGGISTLFLLGVLFWMAGIE